MFPSMFPWSQRQFPRISPAISGGGVGFAVASLARDLDAGDPRRRGDQPLRFRGQPVFLCVSLPPGLNINRSAKS